MLLIMAALAPVHGAVRDVALERAAPISAAQLLVMLILLYRRVRTPMRPTAQPRE